MLSDKQRLAVVVANGALMALRKSAVLVAEEAGVTQEALFFSLWTLLTDQLLKEEIPSEELVGVVLECDRLQHGQEHLS